MTIKLHARTPMAGDCSVGYDVHFDREYTVMDLISEVAAGKEWGIIQLGGTRTVICNYGWREGSARFTLADGVDDQLKNMVIGKCQSCGGWGRMDYYVYPKVELRHD